MKPTTQLRLALVLSVLCFAGIIACLGQLLGPGHPLAPGPADGGDSDRDPALAMIEEVKTELKTLREEQETLAAEKARLSAAVAQQDKVIVAQKEALEDLAEQLRLRPAAP